MAQTIKISDISVLSKSHCRIKCPERVEQKINKLIGDGSNKLQLVTDFDYTLTKQRLANGKKMLSSFCLFELCQSFPAKNKLETQKGVAKYRPIELDPTIPVPEKIVAMLEWWSFSNQYYKYVYFFFFLYFL